ncbi:MAG: hypothetical protein PHR82_06925 [Endomicrobiaceae bacterium]|nr:hypothetical protein [Endomicrobiaceae bacterium]
MFRMRDDILRFIKRFAGSEDTFLYGCCYWFAFILHIRFGGKIAYEPIEGHFIAVIQGVAYDIRGDVTNLYGKTTLIDWECYREKDPLHAAHIERDCVMMDG